MMNQHRTTDRHNHDMGLQSNNERGSDYMRGYYIYSGACVIMREG